MSPLDPETSTFSYESILNFLSFGFTVAVIIQSLKLQLDRSVTCSIFINEAHLEVNFLSAWFPFPVFLDREGQYWLELATKVP